MHSKTAWSRLVHAVRERAPQARVVLVDYLTVIPENCKPCAAVPIPQERQKFLLEVARKLSIATELASQRIGVELVAASKVSRGHDACSTEPWVMARTLGDKRPPKANYHPTWWPQSSSAV